MTALASQVAVALQNARRFEAVQSSERLIRSIIDATPDWIFVKDRAASHGFDKRVLCTCFR